MNDAQLEAFAARLNELCDEKRMPARGRAELLSKKFHVTREAARKWLKGLGYPTTDKRIEICAWAGVTDAWLMSGKGDKHPTVAELSQYQRAALGFMERMTLDEQALAVRILSAIADPHGGLGPIVLNDGPRPGPGDSPRRR